VLLPPAAGNLLGIKKFCEAVFHNCEASFHTTGEMANKHSNRLLLKTRSTPRSGPKGTPHPACGSPHPSLRATLSHPMGEGHLPGAEKGINVIENKVHVHDFRATVRAETQGFGSHDRELAARGLPAVYQGCQRRDVLLADGPHPSSNPFLGHSLRRATRACRTGH
jgi:hypothetical protein